MEDENKRAAEQTPAGERGGESTWFVKLPAIPRKLGKCYLTTLSFRRGLLRIYCINTMCHNCTLCLIAGKWKYQAAEGLVSGGKH